MPNGKEILTMAANKGNAALQYTMKKKNRTNVVIIVLFTILVVIVCYKLQRWFTQKSGSDSDDDDSISSLTRKKQGEEENRKRRTKQCKKDVKKSKEIKFNARRNLNNKNEGYLFNGLCIFKHRILLLRGKIR